MSCVSVLCFVGLAAGPQQPGTLEAHGLALRGSTAGPEALLDTQAGRVLLDWSGETPLAYVTVPGDPTPRPIVFRSFTQSGVEGAPEMRGVGECAEPRVGAEVVLEGPAPVGRGTPAGLACVTLRLTLTNHSETPVSVAGFPGGLRVPEPEAAHLVYPYQSGVLAPLDERFEAYRIHGSLPFINGYPGNLASMNWMGAQWPDASVMVHFDDRYGWLKRFGAVPKGEARELVIEHHVGLPPGETVELPPVRLVSTGAAGYRAMTAYYRDWVQERRHPEGGMLRDRIDGVEKIPVQWRSLEDKAERRPWLEALLDTHGHPEHVLRIELGKEIVYASYGMVEELLPSFERTYGAKVTPQLWSFSRSDANGGWPLFPPNPLASEPVEHHGDRFPGLSMSGFIDAMHDTGRAAVFYANPTFWGDISPDYRPDWMYDITGEGRIKWGGFAAQASQDSAYVSPFCVKDYQERQLARIGVKRTYGVAKGVMYDSSQTFGGTSFSNSLIRRDPVLDIDRNPQARYRKRYGYIGRDSYPQDKLKRDLALDAATPNAMKVGEWVCELSTMYLDMNAGSIDLKREFCDTADRPAENNVIPAPLYQMVYGDAQYFVIRVAAACDAYLHPDDLDQIIPPAMSRRGTSLFGAVHQALYWGGVPWAGPAYKKLYPATYLIVRDNAARRPLFGKRAAFDMYGRDGEAAPGLFRLRETRWLGNDGATLAVHWDNNAGTEIAPPSTRTPWRASALWGSMDYLEGSLDRLRVGSTVTLMANGAFTAWDYAGTLSWDEALDAVIADSAETPQGLCVIWDGERLSFGNAAKAARTVQVSLPARLGSNVTRVEPPEGVEVVGCDPEGVTWSVLERAGRLVVNATLPPAGERQHLEWPMAYVSFTID